MKEKKEDLRYEAFKFTERDVKFKILYEMKLDKKFKLAFDYLLTKMPIQKLKKDLSKLKWDEGKSYDWAILNNSRTYFIIRQYRTHFTIFFKTKWKLTDNETVDEYFHTNYGCFMVHTDMDKVENDDLYCGNKFIDLNKLVKPLFEIVEQNNVHCIWNPLSLERPKYVEVKNVWNGGEDLSQLDEFVFACDELFSKYLELFAQTDMFEKIKTYNVGDMLGTAYEVTKVQTDLKDDYYHGVGLAFKNIKFDKDEKWADVYSLSRFFYEYIFV